jgi:CDP-6-deoxy-D-xylo-4-hexulose-3-dehydrase
MQGETRKTGTFGDIATSSFYPPHHITTGEGGAVYTSNALLARIARSLRDWGRDCACASGQDNRCGCRFNGQFGELPFGYDHKYVYSHFGYNLKATDMQAAIGVAQMDKLENFVAARKRNYALLKSALQPLNDEFILPEPCVNADPSWFGFPLTCKGEIQRRKIVNALEERGVQTRMLFAGNIVRQPCFDTMRKNSGGYRVVGVLENTDIVMERTLWLGVYPGIDENAIAFMAEAIKEAIKH